MSKKENNKGITLIALIITIIVMLILVGVTVALNGGLFTTAKKATADTELQRDKELEIANVSSGMTTQDLINKYKGNDQSEGLEVELPAYEDSEFTDGLLAENAKFESDGYTAVVPKGFKVINGIEGTQSISVGLVIRDAEGNEFVWIPATNFKGTYSGEINN